MATRATLSRVQFLYDWNPTKCKRTLCREASALCVGALAKMKKAQMQNGRKRLRAFTPLFFFSSRCRVVQPRLSRAPRTSAHKLTWLGERHDHQGVSSVVRLAHCTSGFRLTCMAAPSRGWPTAKFLRLGDGVRATPAYSKAWLR